MKLHILRCGRIRVSETVPFGNRIDLGNTRKQLLAPDRDRVELPVFCYLIEHPRGPVLVDTGWCRDISPDGVFDPRAVGRVLPPHLAAFYHPLLPAGEAIHEQLAARGLRAEDLNCIVLTHLDPDHVAGLRHLGRAGRIVLPEDEYFWSCRTVFKARQPRSLWIDTPIERLFYRGSPLGPNRWAIDLFGDESLLLVNGALRAARGGRGLLPAQLAGGDHAGLRLRARLAAQKPALAPRDGEGSRLRRDPLQPRCADPAGDPGVLNAKTGMLHIPVLSFMSEKQSSQKL